MKKFFFMNAHKIGRSFFFQKNNKLSFEQLFKQKEKLIGCLFYELHSLGILSLNSLLLI